MQTQRCHALLCLLLCELLCGALQEVTLQEFVPACPAQAGGCHRPEPCSPAAGAATCTLQRTCLQEHRDCEMARRLQAQDEAEASMTTEQELQDAQLARLLQAEEDAAGGADAVAREAGSQDHGAGACVAEAGGDGRALRNKLGWMSGTLPDHRHDQDEDMCPDVHDMFRYYDDVYFGGVLTRNAVIVEWTNKMTLSAGTCTLRRGSGMQLGLCRIALSIPLLKYRSATEVKETLLHEMIHAADFLSNREREGHGKHFQAKMRLINAGLCPDRYRPERGYSVSICHDFHSEVAHAKATRGTRRKRPGGSGA